MRTRICFAAFLVIAGICAGCAPKSLVSTSQEVDIGKQAAQDVERQYKLVTDPALNAQVNQIGQTLVKCSTRQDITYTFKIIQDKDVNAFSLPGGWVYVNSGLIDATRGKPAQLAGVIAHEIGHIAARHHADMIGRETYAQILVGTLTQGDVQQLASVFANLNLLRWSRKHEYEADKLGIKMLWDCRRHDPSVYDPNGLINFFDNLLSMQESNKEPSEFQQIFSTHPVTQERIVRAREYLGELETGRADLGVCN
jgi:predicted Zn-dependent protease